MWLYARQRYQLGDKQEALYHVNWLHQVTSISVLGNRQQWSLEI